jgi:hypothetical protein
MERRKVDACPGQAVEGVPSRQTGGLPALQRAHILGLDEALWSAEKIAEGMNEPCDEQPLPKKLAEDIRVWDCFKEDTDD